MQPKRRVCYERGVKSRAKAAREPKSARLRRPPPLHQATLEESIARLGLRGVTTKRMFGGLCYYANDKPFSIVLGDALALMDEGRVDAYVLASHRFIAGQGTPEEDLAWNDLLQGREGLYKRAKGKR